MGAKHAQPEAKKKTKKKKQKKKKENKQTAFLPTFSLSIDTKLTPLQRDIS